MNPKVSIIMGSTSDLPVMEQAAQVLDEFEIPFEINALSAHRTPQQAMDFAKQAYGRGIRVIIARSFSRIYFRNAINAGMPAIISPEVVDAVEEGDEITVDMENGKIITPGKEFSFPPYPDTVMNILRKGGLIQFIKSNI